MPLGSAAMDSSIERVDILGDNDVHVLGYEDQLQVHVWLHGLELAIL